jgi:hypothetical protein
LFAYIDIFIPFGYWGATSVIVQTGRKIAGIIKRAATRIIKRARLDRRLGINIKYLS